MKKGRNATVFLAFRRILLSASFLLIPAASGGDANLPQALPELSINKGIPQLVYPIALPPAKVVPDISLTYAPDTSGLAGHGWNLTGLFSIKRSGGILSLLESTMDGTLISIGPDIYHAQNEKFTRYLASGSCGDGPCQFEARTRSGMRYIFGSEPTARLQDTVTGSVLYWALSEVRDLQGNGYVIGYEKVNERELYPVTIDYSGRKVEFLYESRPDSYHENAGGGLLSALKRIEKIRVRLGGSVIRTYSLQYATSTDGKSLLTGMQVTCHGHNV